MIKDAIGRPLEVRYRYRLSLLGSTAVNNGGLDLVLNLTRAGTSCLEFLDDVQALLISNFTEDDVLAIQPGGDNGGDEELGAVTIKEENSQLDASHM